MVGRSIPAGQRKWLGPSRIRLGTSIDTGFLSFIQAISMWMDKLTRARRRGSNHSPWLQKGERRTDGLWSVPGGATKSKSLLYIQILTFQWQERQPQRTRALGDVKDLYGAQCSAVPLGQVPEGCGMSAVLGSHLRGPGRLYGWAGLAMEMRRDRGTQLFAGPGSVVAGCAHRGFIVCRGAGADCCWRRARPLPQQRRRRKRRDLEL